MLVALLDVSTTVKVNAWPGSQQMKGRVGRIGNGQECVLYQHHSGSPKSLCDPMETCAATNVPVVQPYLWVAEGVLQVVQVVPCPPGLASCLQRYPVTGAFLKGDIVVLRCALPQSWLWSGFLRRGLWALHTSTLPHTQLQWSCHSGPYLEPLHVLAKSMASALFSTPSFLSFSPQITLTCPVPALTFSLLLLLVPLSPLLAQRQWLQGLTIFLATFLCHMIPQCRVWSQQKALTPTGLNIRCGQEGNSWRRGKGEGEGGKKAVKQTEAQVWRQKADRKKQKLLSRRSLLSHLPILSKPYLQWEQNSVGFLVLFPDTRCPKDWVTIIKMPATMVR